MIPLMLAIELWPESKKKAEVVRHPEQDRFDYLEGIW